MRSHSDGAASCKQVTQLNEIFGTPSHEERHQAPSIRSASRTIRMEPHICRSSPPQCTDLVALGYAFFTKDARGVL
jgi:hypothetical protein